MDCKETQAVQRAIMIMQRHSYYKAQLVAIHRASGNYDRQAKFYHQAMALQHGVNCLVNRLARQARSIGNESN